MEANFCINICTSSSLLNFKKISVGYMQNCTSTMAPKRKFFNFGNMGTPCSEKIQTLQYCPGHPELAAFQASDPDVAVFRKFNELGCRNLIEMQSILFALERDLRMVDERIDKSRTAKAESTLDRSITELNVKKQDVLDQVRSHLKSYCKQMMNI